MNDREIVLARIRNAVLHKERHPGAYRAPDGPGGWDAFADRLTSVGGEPAGPYSPSAAGPALRLRATELADGGRIVAEASAAAEVGHGPWDVAPSGGLPHAFADVAVAIVRGEIACAENGAVAVCGADAPHRALAVLCRHLILVVDPKRVVTSFHDAFDGLPANALDHHHVTWISGPSKTADIEQSLVFGAHGPLTLDVFAIER